MERVAFLGCSRGLGKAICHEMNKQGLLDFSLLISRKEKALKTVALQIQGKHRIISLDFSKKSNLHSILEIVKKHKIKRLFYFAGGGPYGNFTGKDWKDHKWAFQVSFLTPAFLLHQLLKEKNMEQMIFTGSFVTHNKPDPLTASYTSAKEALHSLVTTVIKENPKKDLRLFRPGYMDTDLIPPGAFVRKNEKLLDPKKVASEFLKWAQNPEGPRVFDVKKSIL